MAQLLPLRPDELSSQYIGRPIAWNDGDSHVPDERDQKRPICVNLNGTLVKTDTLVEGLIGVLSSGRGLATLAGMLTLGRAALKQRVAEIAGCAADLLPYNSTVLAYLREKRQEGHRIVLATAADAGVAKAVADHLELFDEVICSDGAHNLKGTAKAAALVERFGTKGFDYVGNDRSDLPVWREAAGSVTVNARRSVTQQVRELGSPTTTFDSAAQLAPALLRAMRPHQWSKNLLVFVPMIAALALTQTSAWVGAILLFLSLSATASALYIVNDTLDVSSDRRHPRKCLRPVASGALPIPAALTASMMLLAIGLALAWAAGSILVIVAYAVLSLAYSLWLKRYPLVDVFALAALYTVRVLGGGLVTGYQASVWLLAFSGFTFLSLALVKRVGEMLAIERSANKHSNSRRGYRPCDLPLLQILGCAATFSSSIVLTLFITTHAAIQDYRAPETLTLVVPIILFWQCRLWLATVRGNMHDDPIVYTVFDWVTWPVAATILGVMLFAQSGIYFW